MKKILLALPIFIGFIPKVAVAHCPLCTVGAGALAVLAASLGVSSVVVGILIGAAALALGLWLSKLVQKRYIPYQKQLLAFLVFAGTVVPIMPLVREFAPLYIYLGGSYGTLLHNTYTINLYILGVVIGAGIMFVAPYLSRLVTSLRGGQIPYQGISITLALLITISVISQLLS